MKAIILAAGFASSLDNLTKNRSKALLPLRGKPIIDYLCENLKNIPSITDIIVVSNHRYLAQFLEWKHKSEKRFQQNIQILDDFTTSPEERLGIFGDLGFAVDRLNIDESVFVLTTSYFLQYDLINPWRVFREFSEDVFLIAEQENFPHYPDEKLVQLDAEDRIIKIDADFQENQKNFKLLNTYIFEAESLHLLVRFLEGGGDSISASAFPQWLSERKSVRGVQFFQEIHDIKNAEDYFAIEKQTDVSFILR